MFRDLPEFLRLLDQEGELLTVATELAPEHEIAAAIREVEEKTTKALYLERIKGYPFHMVGNLLGHKKRISLALGSPEDPVAEYGKRRKRPISPIRVKYGPVQEVTHTESIDLHQLVPALTHHEGDAGPYLTSALAIARDPESGILSCGIHRVQLKGRDRIGILLNNPPIADFFRKAESLSRPLPIAFVIGCDPLTLLSSVIRAPNEEKLAIGGGLASRPVEVVYYPEFDLEVPAHSEFVLLGEVIPGTREIEGPFGETSGYYMTFESPVGRINKVTHRKKAIYHSLLPFSCEDSTLIEFLWEAENFSKLREHFPCLIRIHFPPRTLGLTVLVSIKPAPHNQVKELIQSLWKSIPIAKNVIVVDEDVSLDDESEIWWALSTRFRAGEHLWVERGGRRMSIDPSTQGESVARMGIDATAVGDGAERYRKIQIDGRVRNKIKHLLKPYL